MEPPLIGSKISLISMNEIRYEGVLFDINKVDTTIALKDVLSFGTENRTADKFVAPNDKVYPFIKFRGIDIKDLHVHNVENKQPGGSAAAPLKPAPPPPPPVPQPEIQFGDLEPPPPNPGSKPTGANWSNGPPPTLNRKAAALAPSPQQQQAGVGARGGTRNPPGVLPGMGAALTHRRVRGGNGKTGEDVSAEFDFGQSNSGFNKEADKEKLLGNQAVMAPKKAYNPSASFFDEISCDATERARGSNGYSTQEERKKNSETFGATSLQEQRRRNSRSGGKGGKGGKGGGQHYGQPHGGAVYAPPPPPPPPAPPVPPAPPAPPAPVGYAGAAASGATQHGGYRPPSSYGAAAQRGPQAQRSAPPHRNPATAQRPAAATAAGGSALPPGDGYQQVRRRNRGRGKGGGKGSEGGRGRGSGQRN